jgi:hypothetical protein
MIEPPRQRLLLAQLEAQSETRRHLRVNRAQDHRPCRAADDHRSGEAAAAWSPCLSWTHAERRLFQHVAERTPARLGRIDALTRKLERQELAIVVLLSHHSSPAAP